MAAAPAEHFGRTYDLVGHPITAGQVAGELGVPHRTISLGRYRSRLLVDATLLPFQPPMLTSIASGVRHGFLASTGPDLEHLLGRPLTPVLAVAARAASATRAGEGV